MTSPVTDRCTREKQAFVIRWCLRALSRRGARVLAIGLLAVVTAALGSCSGPRMPPLVPHAPESPRGRTLVVLGDTQRTTWMEAVLLGREQNDEARVALIQKIAAEEAPALVVHLGDMVAYGSSTTDWEYYDRLMSPLTARKIPIYPVLGNHDYWGRDEAALREARRRYPPLRERSYYSMQQGTLGLIWLDSNLTGPAASEQTAWFDRILSRFDAAPDVSAVIVFTHHPPYTNGKGRHPDAYVRGRIVPRLRASSKAIVLMSGHVHGYERFQSEGRTFIVTGGAGGPRVEYATGDDAPFVPAFVTPSGARRPLNYVVIEPKRRSLGFTVKCLERDGACESGILETFTVRVGELRAPAQK